jgi:hypothetical protein
MFPKHWEWHMNKEYKKQLTNRDKAGYGLESEATYSETGKLSKISCYI